MINLISLFRIIFGATGNRSLRVLSYIALIPIMAYPLQGEEIVHTLRFNRTDMTFRKIREYDGVFLKGCDVSSQIGEPQLPVYTLQIMLPENQAYRSFRVIRDEKAVLPERVYLFPSQPPRIPSRDRRDMTEFIPAKAEVYSKTDVYPEECVQCLGTGVLGKSVMVSFQVFPLQIIPASGELMFHSVIEIGVEHEPADGYSLRKMKVPPSHVLETIAGRMAENHMESPHSKDRTLKHPISSDDQYPYLIITSEDLVPAFTPLAHWKKRKGLRTIMSTTETIYSSFLGFDRQEKIRNYIQYAWQTYGVQWVLLGGDHSIIPVRWAYAMDCEWGGSGDENRIPCDLYYSDLDSTWDGNGNFIYGEVDDGVDLYPDVFVGRIPARTPIEVTGFINKLKLYEQNPSLDYLQTVLFAAEILWRNPYTDSGIGKDMIEEAYLPDFFRPALKLYQSRGNETVESVKNALNEGVHFLNHNGHAWNNVMGMGSGYFSIQDADGLYHPQTPFITFSIGCWPGAFDRDCIGEHLVLNPDGGAVAFIGNSRFGWGSPGNPGYGYSDRFDQQFYRFIFTENVRHIGAALAAAKAHYVGNSRWENVYRWHQYQLNLLGDPEMEIWTQRPDSMKVVPESGTGIDASVFSFRVTEARPGGLPIQDTRVTLTTTDDDWVASSTTDFSGKVSFELDLPLPDSLKVTAVHSNYLPEMWNNSTGGQSIPNGPHVVISNTRFKMADGEESVDGEIHPGETIEIKVSLKNMGNASATDCRLILRSHDSYVTLSDTTANYGSILPGETVESFQEGGLRFTVDPACPDLNPVSLHCIVMENDVVRATSMITALVRAPSFSFSNWQLVTQDSHFTVLSPGDNIDLSFVVKNNGGMGGLGEMIRFKLLGSFLEVNPDILDIADFAIGVDDSLIMETHLQVKHDCPDPAFPLLVIELEYLGESGFGPFCIQDTMQLMVGNYGFKDDLEMMRNGWTHTGEGDLWGVSARRSYSGASSWYCGREDSGDYEDNMNSILLTPPFVLPPQGQLRFWQWNEVTIYGVDGLYVEIGHHTLETDSEEWELLDFIGSGGALGLLPIGNDWIEEIYDLSCFPPGDTFRVRLRFISDGADVAEGFYVDDIVIESVTEPQIVHSTYQPGSQFILYPNYPNPFNASTTIGFFVPPLNDCNQSKAFLTVFNLMGQPVRKWEISIHRAGDYSIVWDGKNGQQVSLPSGVYLYQVRIGEQVRNRKMILME